MPTSDETPIGAPSLSSLCVSMFTPWRERCGISDYSRHLVTALRALPDIRQVRIVEAPSDVIRSGKAGVVVHFVADGRRFRALGAEMNAGDPDVAHVQHQYFFFGGVAPHKNHAHTFLHAVRVPVVMTVHEIAQADASDSAVRRQALALVNRANFLHPAIRRMIVHTLADAERLVALGVAAGRIHVIPVGVPPALPMPEPEEAKRALGLEGRRVLTLFGFLSAKKGHRLALNALRRLPDDIVLLFAGEQHPDDHTSYVPELRAEIDRLGLADCVRITGFLPDDQIPVVMAATDIALAPFLQSSGSASLAHLFAYARPIVASDIPPHQQIALEQPNSLLRFRDTRRAPESLPADLSGSDVDGLVSAINHLLTDHVHRAALQVAAHGYAERHSYAQMALETLAIYRLAAANR
jgi:glycosyltransferase involved in cell wall biosynthesis